jgi:hypothetical protein
VAAFISATATRTYTKPRDSTSLGAWSRPLVVAWVPRAGAVLTATEDRPGVSVDVGGATGIYHDGLWQLGSGPDEVDIGWGTVYWDQSDLHSLTFGIADGTVAIRASRLAGVGLDELEQIGVSI